MTRTLHAAPAGWYPRRGEVCLAQLDKVRPIIVLSINSLNKYSLDVCVVPVTGVAHREFSVRVPIRAGEGGLDIKCWAKCDQVNTLEKKDLKYPPLGVLSEATFRIIQLQVRICLGLV